MQRDERLVDERAQHVDDVVTLEPVARADAFRRGEREAVDEGGAAPEQRALAVGEELMAPVEGRGERLLALTRPPRSAGEQAEPVVEPARDLVRREMADTGSGEL